MFVRTVGIGLALVVSAAGLVAATPGVRTFGTIRQLVSEHDAEPKVVLADLLADHHAYGLGSLSDLRGEITILDGTAWLSYPPSAPGERPKVVASSNSPERAGFLVTTEVPPAAWKRVLITEALSSDSFEASLAKLVARHGATGADVPFQLEGTFPSLTFAIADGRRLPPGPSSEEAMKKANYLESFSGVEGTLVGFFALKADERFTHAGTRVHVHGVIPSRRATGHAQAFTIEPGALLWLPVAR